MEINPRILLFKYKLYQKDKKCFILGSGPSILDIDLSILKSHITIVCNHFNKGLKIKNLNFVPTITAFISGKGFNMNDVKSPIVLATPNIRILNYNPKKHKNVYFLYPDREVFGNYKCYTRRKEDMLYDRELDKVYRDHFKHSIACILIKLATNLGFKDLHLFGLDIPRDSHHFWDKNGNMSEAIKDPEYLNQIYRGYEIRMDEFKNSDINIYDCTIKSNLKHIMKTKSINSVLNPNVITTRSISMRHLKKVRPSIDKPNKPKPLTTLTTSSLPPEVEPRVNKPGLNEKVKNRIIGFNRRKLNYDDIEEIIVPTPEGN